VGTEPELKEGFYIEEDLPVTHPNFLQKKLNSGSNIWPASLEGIDDFKKTASEYYKEVCKLKDVLAVLALSLDLAENYFNGFTFGAVATMRLLHYPPQPAESDEKLSRGIGAHTDFGAVTLLMQEEVDGLQVWDNGTKAWLDVSAAPKLRIFIDNRKLSLHKGAYVVTLGNIWQHVYEVVCLSDKFVLND
jgi:isopenicillin N synthase-like dioxygenase